MRLAFPFAVSAALLAALLAAPSRAAEITPNSVLGVTTDMSLGEAKAVLADVEWTWISRYMVDLSALCAERDGEQLFCAIVYGAEALEEDTPIEGLVVTSPKLATADGVRVGKPIAEVAELWGAARFGYDTQNESREYVSFDGAPQGYLLRATMPGEHSFHVGIYADENSGASFYQTGAYPPEAVVESIWMN